MQEKWTLIEAQSQYCTRGVVGRPKGYHPSDTLQHTWTEGDAQSGRCLPEEVGTSRLPPFQALCPPEGWAPPEEPEVFLPTAAPTSARELVQEYLEVFHAIGGRQALVKQAKLNPMKFYDQLLKVLLAADAPKAAVAVQINLAQLSRDEITALSSADLKRLLLEAKD